MGNELSNRSGKHDVHADQLKRDFPVLTATFLEHATKVVGDNKYLAEDDLSKSLFAKIPDFGSVFFQRYHNAENYIDLVTFLNIGSQFSSHGLTSSSENMLKFYSQIFSSDKRTLDKNEITKFFRVCMQSSLAIARFCEPNLDFDKVTFSFITFMLDGCDSITLEEFCQHLNQCVPFCSRDLHDHVVYRLLKRINVKMNTAGKQQEPADECDIYKICSSNESSVKISGLWLIPLLTPIAFVPSSEIGSTSIFSRVLEHNGWHILYESSKQGLSANGFTSKVLGYQGPTLTYFRFGMYLILLGLDIDWREGPTKRGGNDCFLYQLLPKFRIIQSNSGECVHFNLTNRTIKKGITVSRDKRELFELDSDFSAVTYDMQTFSLSRLEVWGCGGSGNYQKYVGQKQWEKKDIAKHQNRKLRPEDWKDSPDKVLLDYGGIETGHAKRGDL